VLRGEDDLVVTREMSRQAVAGIDDARFVELADCGHAPTVDDPNQLLAAVEPFLDVSQTRGTVTVCRRCPTPSISTTTSSPSESEPTPSGVPVAMTSPGSRVT